MIILYNTLISSHEEDIQDIDIYDVVEMPNIPARITDDQVIEEFMLEEEEIDFQGIDEYKIVKLQDVPIKVVNEQELEECMQEEVVSDMTLPEIYRVDERIHIDVQLEIPIIKSEEGHIVQDEPKLVQDRTLICDIPNPLQTNAQAQHMTEQKVSLPDRANIGKTIPTTYVSRREGLGSEVVRKEIPTYIDSIQYTDPLPSPLSHKIPKERGKWIFIRKPYMKSVCRPPPKPNRKKSR